MRSSPEPPASPRATTAGDHDMVVAKYSLAKNLVTALPGVREWAASAFTLLPDQISPGVYRWMRAHVFKDNKRLEVFEQAFSHLTAQAGQPGDYLEFGVARGTSLISAFEIARRLDLEDMRFFAFDSFEGLPASEGRFAKGTMAYGLPYFQRFCAKAGVDLDRVVPVAGFFDVTLTEATRDRCLLTRGCHLVHIDCDLYVSAVRVLDFVEPLLAPGSVMIFDDWFSFEDQDDPRQHGEQRAFHEWPAARDFVPLAETPDWNMAFVRTRRSDPTAAESGS